jgi:hypothetical protein
MRLVLALTLGLVVACGDRLGDITSKTASLKASSGVPHLCPHALRHYWTEHFDGDLLELMRAGGWNSLTMVDRYRGHRPPQRDRISTLASALAATPRSRSKRKSPNQGDGLHVVRREAAQLVS